MAILVGSALLGLIAGLVWAEAAPRAVFVVVSHGAADVANPETKAFIAADGWFCVIAAGGGIVTGLLGYLLAVRRYGALPMTGVLGGGVAAAFAARWVGQRMGAAAFDARLATSKPGTLLRAPVMLGAHGALAFWPLVAGLTAGGIEAIMLLRERQRMLARRGAHAAAYSYGSVMPSWRHGSGGGSRAEPGTAHRPAESSSPGEMFWPGNAPGPRSPGPGGSSGSLSSRPDRPREAGQDAEPGQ
jgi:hypothetical protein